MCLETNPNDKYDCDQDELEAREGMLEALQTVKAEIEYSFEMDTKIDLETILKIVDSAINKAI
tara:strand:- start:1225 stop:1413 length:189 start_codon:yes stop_codon:yes gene_type:complete